MKVSPVFNHPITKIYFKSEKDRLLLKHLEQKGGDRITLSKKNEMLSILKQQYGIKSLKILASNLSPSAKYKTTLPGSNQKPLQIPTNELKPPIPKPELPPTPPFIDLPIIRPGPPAFDPPMKGIPENPWWFNSAPVQPPFEGNPPIRIPELPWIGEPNPVPPNEDDIALFDKLKELIKQAIADRLSVPIEDINVVDYQKVYWSDTSMGNPQPGYSYAQVIVPGYKITVSVGDEPAYSYDFYAILDYSGKELRSVVPVDPPWKQPPTEKLDQMLPITPPVDLPTQPLLTIWDTILETVKNNPILKAIFKDFLKSVKISPTPLLTWKAQVEKIPGLKAFWEKIEKL